MRESESLVEESRSVTRVYVHVLGGATIGLMRGEAMEVALSRFRRDPLFVPESSPEAREHGEWALPLTKAARCDVDVVVLIATEQTPPHPLDTAPIAQELTQGSIEEIFLSEGRQPPKVRIVTVRDFSIGGFMAASTDEIRSLGAPSDLDVVLEMGAGSSTAFTGALLGTLRAGCLPTVLQLSGNNEREVDTRSIIGRHIDVSRWLVRHRLWQELSVQSRIDESLRSKLCDLADFESMRRIPDHSRIHKYVYSDILGRIARGDQSWIPRIQRLVESTWGSMFLRMNEAKLKEISDELDRCKSTGEPLTVPPNEPLSRRMYEVAQKGGERWRNCSKVMPAEIVDFWEKSASRFRSRFAKWDHDRLTSKQYSQESPVAEAMLAKFVSRASVVLGSAAFSDTAPRDVFDIAQPFRLFAPCEVRFRNIGTSENAQLKSAVLSDSLVFDATEMLEYKPSDEGKPDAFLDTEVTCEQMVAMLTANLGDIEERGSSVRLLSTYLNQGSKPMTLASICASLAVAFEYGIELRFKELAEVRSQDSPSQSEIRELANQKTGRLVGGLMPLDSVATACSTALRRLDMDLAKTLAEFLPAVQRNSVDRVADFYLGSSGNNRMEKAAKSVARCGLVLRQVREIGEVEAIIAISQLLSGNFIDERIDKDQWGEILDDMWKARNEALHLRFAQGRRMRTPSIPVGLSVEKMAESIRRPSYGETYLAEVHRYNKQLTEWFDQAEASLGEGRHNREA